MEFNQFVNEVKGGIKQFLPIEYEDAQVRIEEVKKLNENYLGITVLKENQVIAPTFNLNQLYKMYQSDPEISMGSILRSITELVLDVPEQFNPKSITEYENAKKKLFIRVSSAEKNEEMLQNVPHQMREDLAITYHLAIRIDDIGVGSTTITNDILKRYGISEEQLHADAMANSEVVRPASMRTMAEVMAQMMGMSVEDFPMDMSGPQMYVVTNEEGFHGAAAAFYPDFMDNAAKELGGNFFILPSSVHEMLFLSDDGHMNVSELRDMVTSINASEVAPADRLTDSVYHYDAEARIFELGESWEARSAEREAEKGSVLDALKEKQQSIGDRPKAEHHKAKNQPEL